MVKPRADSESAVLDLLSRLSHGNTRLFRMHVGTYRALHSDEIIRIGIPGMSDLIGLQSVTVTPDMVGQRIAVFAAIEVKSPTGRARPNQLSFIHVVERMGGYAGIARSVADGRKILRLT